VPQETPAPTIPLELCVSVCFDLQDSRKRGRDREGDGSKEDLLVPSALASAGSLFLVPEVVVHSVAV